jgi:4-hydroxybenzoate polyprenyltransferase
MNAPTTPQTLWQRLRVVLEMIKIEHTLFAMPFALMGALLAARGIPSAAQIFWIVVAMVGARSAAMAFNRLADREFDAANPRTKMRAIPAGLISVGFVTVFTVAASVLFIVAAVMLNPLAGWLSPVALAIVFFYSLTKRFTAWSHAFLGLALACAPIGAWIAVAGTLTWTPLLLGAAVVCWLIGFDVIYALQDVEFDRGIGLKSLPARYGAKKALTIARISHSLMILLLFGVGLVAGLDIWFCIGVVIAALLIAIEHIIIQPDDLRRLNVAFFNLNVIIATELLVLTAFSVLK